MEPLQAYFATHKTAPVQNNNRQSYPGTATSPGSSPSAFGYGFMQPTGYPNQMGSSAPYNHPGTGVQGAQYGQGMGAVAPQGQYGQGTGARVPQGQAFGTPYAANQGTNGYPASTTSSAQGRTHYAAPGKAAIPVEDRYFFEAEG